MRMNVNRRIILVSTGSILIILVFVYYIEQTSILIVLSKCFHIDRVGINKHYYVPDNGSAKYDRLFTNGGQQTLKPHTNVLLFGYQRGETTFVGHIIGCREDTFYFYEPLWSLSRKKYFTKDKQCWVNKEACRNYNNTVTNITSLITSLYKCETLALTKLISKVQSEHSCSRNRNTFREKNIANLKHICLQANSGVTKILRISAELLRDIINKNPHVKIVYLYRDPRAIISSRRKIHKGPLQTTMVKAICNKMNTDSGIVLNLASEYPTRVILVSAERIAKNPITVSKQLFEFLNINFKIDDENQINDLSNWDRKHKRRKYANFYPFKNDGYASSMNWRKVLSLEDKNRIDKICQDVYHRLGYLNMSSPEEFRNISFLNIIKLKIPVHNI